MRGAKICCLWICTMLFAVASAACAQTQADMTRSACAGVDKTKEELQAVIAEIKTKRSQDQNFLTKFDAAELAWDKFADAQIAADYPSDDPRADYGSAF